MYVIAGMYPTSYLYTEVLSRKYYIRSLSSDLKHCQPYITSGYTGSGH